jgi:cytochrome c-type biogenesis protein CcmH/NrfG
MGTNEEHWEAAQEGAERLAEGDPEGAQQVLEPLVEEDPENEYGFFFLGAAHYEQENYAKALAAYVRALELAPEYVGAMVNAGHTLRMLGRYDQAIRMARQVLARDKHDPDALFLMGASYFARGDNKAAMEHLQAFLETGPEFEVAAEAEGMLQIIRGEVVEALPSEEPD